MIVSCFSGPRWIWPARRSMPDDPFAKPPWWDGVLAAILVGVFFWFYGRWVWSIVSGIGADLTARFF